MNKNKIISFLLLLIVMILILGLVICMMTTPKPKKTSLVEGFYNDSEKKDIRYKNLHSLFVLLTMLQTDINVNLQSILLEEGFNWLVKFKPSIFNDEIKTIDIRKIFPNPSTTNNKTNQFFYFDSVIKKDKDQNGSEISYNILQKNYLIINDTKFKEFIKTIQNTLTFHSEDNLNSYNISDNYEGNALYSQLLEMLIVSAYIPSSLEHMYLMPYNELLNNFPKTFIKFEDYVMLGQMYSCANQMNLSMNNLCDVSGNRLSSMNFVVDVTNYEPTLSNIPIPAKTIEFMKNIKYMFYKQNNNLSNFNLGLQTSYVQFYLALQYFVKKMSVSTMGMSQTLNAYVPKYNNYEKINENVRMDQSSIKSFNNFVNSYNNSSIVSPLNQLDSIYKINALFKTKGEINNETLKQVTNASDYYSLMTFFQISYDLIYGTVLNLSLVNGRVSTEAPVDKLEIIRSLYKLLITNMSLPLDSIYFNVNNNEEYKKIFNDVNWDSSNPQEIGFSEFYGRFITYYETLQQLRTYTSTQNAGFVKVGNVQYDKTSENTIKYSPSSDIKMLVQLLRYFVMYNLKNDDLFKISTPSLMTTPTTTPMSTSMPTSTPVVLANIITFINKKKPYLFNAYNPSGSANVTPPYPNFIAFVNTTFNSVDIHDDNRLINPQSVIYVNSRTDINNIMQKAYATLNEIIHNYNTIGYPPTEQNDLLDQYTITSFILTFCLLTCTLCKIYETAKNDYDNVRQLFNEIDYSVFCNMVVAGYGITEIPVLKIIDANNVMEYGLHGIMKKNKDETFSKNNDLISNNDQKQWNTFGLSTTIPSPTNPATNINVTNLYRLNLENDVTDSFNPNKTNDFKGLLLNHPNLIYVYYGILHFVTNPFVVV